MNRRKFLTKAGQLSAGTLLLGAGLNASAQSRRVVMLEGVRTKVVDIHAHCVSSRWYRFSKVLAWLEQTSIDLWVLNG